MTNKKESKSLTDQFTENLIAITDHIPKGALNAMEDEDGRQVITAYSKSFKNQFLSGYCYCFLTRYVGFKKN